MERIEDINEENIDEQELFCKKSKKNLPGYINKVNWLKARFREGLKYKVLYVKEGDKETSRGMIEYIPGEFNWRGIEAEGWMVIHCIWVVGKAKGKGYGDKLLQLAIDDAKKNGMHGVVGMSAEKGGWLPNKKLFLKNGFVKIDEIAPNFSLYAIQFNKNSPKPRFNPIDENLLKQYSEGVTITYTDQCPYITDLVEDLKKLEKKKDLRVIKINDCKEAQKNNIFPYGTYCILYNGQATLYKHATKKEIMSILNS